MGQNWSALEVEKKKLFKMMLEIDLKKCTVQWAEQPDGAHCTVNMIIKPALKCWVRFEMSMNPLMLASLSPWGAPLKNQGQAQYFLVCCMFQGLQEISWMNCQLATYSFAEQLKTESSTIFISPTGYYEDLVNLYKEQCERSLLTFLTDATRKYLI